MSKLWIIPIGMSAIGFIVTGHTFWLVAILVTTILAGIKVTRT